MVLEAQQVQTSYQRAHQAIHLLRACCILLNYPSPSGTHCSMTITLSYKDNILTLIATFPKAWQTAFLLPRLKSLPAPPRAKPQCLGRPCPSVSLPRTRPYESHSSHVGQASIVDGMCETTMRVVTQERRIRFDILTKKQNVITELLTRLQRWNDMQCRYCKTALRDQGPRVPAMYELVYIENPDVFKRRVALGEELPDNTEVLARLARTGEYLAHLRGDARTEAGSSTSISPTSL